MGVTFPVLLSAVYFGAVTGSLVGLAAFPLNALLVAMLTDVSWTAWAAAGGIAGTGLTVLVAYVVGRQRELMWDLVRSREEQQRLSGQLLRTQKMEMIGTLAGGVAHDFNNLLTVVKGNASLALIELPRDSPLRSSIHAIEDAASHGADLVRQMLTYAGEGKVSRESVDVSKLIEKLGPLLTTSVPDPMVIDYNLHRGLPPIMANPTQVSQVVINLVANASEAIGNADGAITVGTGMLTHDVDGSGSALQTEILSGTYVYIEVSDTGLGMDAATQAKMWDPFFTTKFAGRGLGLAAVHGIVHSYGGATEVVSQPGRGTRVRTLFPVTEQAP